MKQSALSAPALFQSDPAMYERIVNEVLSVSRPMMERVCEATRRGLQARLDVARTPGEHNAMLEAKQQIIKLALVMSDRYPEALRKVISQQSLGGQQPKTASRSLFTVHFDELELMDEEQVSESVERARARQVLINSVEEPLANLDALFCAAQGIAKVEPQYNPLRPEVFLQALQTVISQMQVTDQVRHDWMASISPALGSELRALYLTQIQRLRQSGVQPVGYAVRQADGQYVYLSTASGGASLGFSFDNDFVEEASTSASASTSGSSSGPGESPSDPLLTLDRLRRLLQGELSDAPDDKPSQPKTRAESFAEHFDREFESPRQLPSNEPPATDAIMTMPAAFEALQEMGQVGHMMERLSSGAGGTPAKLLRKNTGGLGGALSMEVVALMVDNIASDTRLPWPVQQFVRALEPALMQLALVDPRFFSNKQHSARRLLQEITERSLAFDSHEAPGFQAFMLSLMNIAGPLATATIEGPDVFDSILAQLQATWAEAEKERQRAIKALQHAEQRHQLAAKISRDIWLLPQIGNVPHKIARFLLGPWAKVLAQARLTDESNSPDPGRYQELVDTLIWSSQPELTRANTGQLAQLLPKLLAKLREGLESIDYPPERTKAVFDLLMQLHQQAFKPAPKAAAAPRPPRDQRRPKAPSPMDLDLNLDLMNNTLQLAALEDEEPWVAPMEARDSGFMEFDQLPEPESPASAPAPAAPGNTPERSALVMGCWVILLVGGKWERTKLSWIGPSGKLFLFTSATGRSQSMTLRLVDRMIQQGTLRILTQQNVVDNALDTVAQVAMRNSMESRL